jgi:hypothetical protein
MNFYNILMVQSFQNLRLDEDVVYIADWANILGFYDFDCEFLACLPMSG